MPVQRSTDWLAMTVKVMRSVSSSSNHSARYEHSAATQPDGVDQWPRIDDSAISIHTFQPVHHARHIKLKLHGTDFLVTSSPACHEDNTRKTASMEFKLYAAFYVR